MSVRMFGFGSANSRVFASTGVRIRASFRSFSGLPFIVGVSDVADAYFLGRSTGAQ